VRGDAELLGDELLPVVGLGTDQGLVLADGGHWVAAVRAGGLAARGRELAGTGHDALGSAVTVGAEQRGVGQQEVMDGSGSDPVVVGPG
jgi:hypothetical protein